MSLDKLCEFAKSESKKGKKIIVVNKAILGNKLGE